MIYLRSKILFLFICCFAYFPSFGTHIVGGQISYECLGNDIYQMTIKVYRDCQSNGAAFDSAPNSNTTGTVSVFLGDDPDTIYCYL